MNIKIKKPKSNQPFLKKLNLGLVWAYHNDNLYLETKTISNQPPHPTPIIKMRTRSIEDAINVS